MAEVVTLTCVICQKTREVFANVRRAPSCCKSCSMKITAKTRKPRSQIMLRCPCGVVKPADHRRMKFCSRRCASHFKPNPKKGKRYPHLQRAKVVACPCGVSFRAVKSTKMRPSRFHSFECYQRYKTKGETSIETTVREALTSLGLFFEQQKRVGSWVVDFLVLPDTVIECDGTYWHSLPKSVERDARKDAWLADHGYEIVRLPEKEIRELGARDVIRRRWTKFAKSANVAVGSGGLE